MNSDDIKLDDETLNKASAKYAPKDETVIEAEVLGKEEKLNTLFSTVDKLKPFFDDFTTIFSMLKDWIFGNYREIPFKTIAYLAGVLLYVLSPLDLIADFIPFIGYLDDAALLALATKVSKSDIEKYRSWKEDQKKLA